MYLDDSLIVGDIEVIDDYIAAIKENRLVQKPIEGLHYYLSCKINFSMEKNRAWLKQPYLIQNVAKKFGKHVKNIYSHKTPGMLNFLIVRPMVESKKISPEYQQEYW